MKTNFKVNIPAFNIEKDNMKIEIPSINISTELEASVSEIRGLYDLQKEALKDLPGLVRDLVNTVEDMLAQDEYEAGKKLKERAKEKAEEAERQEREKTINDWYIEMLLCPDTDKITKDVVDIYNHIFGHRDVTTFVNEKYNQKNKFFNVMQDMYF